MAVRELWEDLFLGQEERQGGWGGQGREALVPENEGVGDRNVIYQQHTGSLDF